MFLSFNTLFNLLFLLILNYIKGKFLLVDMYKINFKPRLYQESIFHNTTLYNSLVVLPTGLGKTAIAMMLSVYRINNFPDKKVLFLAPTKPLVEQHYRSFLTQSSFSEDELVVFTGSIPPAKRKEFWPKAKIIFATPQGIENDLINSNIDLKEVSVVIFDEAHRATGNYSYVWIAKHYVKTNPSAKILALTASPGSDLDSIKLIVDNLYIDKIEVRKLDDPDVADYVQDTKIEWLNVDLPKEYLDLQFRFKTLLEKKLKEIKYYGYLNSTKLTKSELLRFQISLQKEIAEKGFDESLLKSISLAAEALKIEHAIELLETQGITSLRLYIKDMITKARSTKNKSVINLVADAEFKIIANIIENMFEANDEHPKIKKLLSLLDEIYSRDKKIIIFSQFRDTGEKICEVLNDAYKEVIATVFVGQAKKRSKGLSQKQQIEILDQFRNNEFNILVSSSVGEEGLDIPKVDYVIFYEPVPSSIRTIQRRGRTGRSDEGSIYVLVSKNTRDEGYKWASIHKEKRMHTILQKLKKSELALRVMTTQKIQDLNSSAANNNSLCSYVSCNTDANPSVDVESMVDVKPVETSEDEDGIISTSSSSTISNQDAVIISDPSSARVKIIVDFREKNSAVIKNLIDNDFLVKLDKLEVGDYLLSKDVIVEYKTDLDFVNSIVDGRLLMQLKQLKNMYKKPIIIIEGSRDLYSIRNIHPNSIRGVLATIAVSYNIPILYTISSKDTAMIMKTIAMREQLKDENKEFTLHFEKPLKSNKQMQEYIVSSFPGIGMHLAKPLLTNFKTLKNLANASVNDLQKIELIGKVKAQSLYNLFNYDYTI